MVCRGSGNSRKTIPPYQAGKKTSSPRVGLTPDFRFFLRLSGLSRHYRLSLHQESKVGRSQSADTRGKLETTGSLSCLLLAVNFQQVYNYPGPHIRDSKSASTILSARFSIPYAVGDWKLILKP